MFSAFSSGQRSAVLYTTVAAGQACVAAGVWFGWSPMATLASSLGFTALSLLSVWGNSSALRAQHARVASHAQRMAAGDLTQDLPTIHNDEALTALQALQVALRQALGIIRGGADGVSVAAQEIATGNLDLSNRTEQTASSLQQAASSMTQLTGTVNQTADSARTANQLASSASEVAQRGGSVVAQVVATMDAINTSSKKIADIIGTIDGIAFQTNILALNAAVEAARAGEQGRGFAVVAGEVRSLAQRSAEAAREIKSLINSSVEKVESGSRLVADAGHTMTEIVASVQRVTDIIGEISAAAAEQSGGIGQVSGAVAELDRMTQQNAALVEESAAAAQSLKDQSSQLATAIAGFKLNVVSGSSSSRALGAGFAAPSSSHASPSSNPKAAARQVIHKVSSKAAKTTLAPNKAATATTAATPKAVAKPAASSAATAAAGSASTHTNASTAGAPSGGSDDWESF